MDTLELEVVPSASAPDSRAQRPHATSARLRPCHRPPLALRVGAASAALGALLATAALLLSDRAPGVLESLLGDRVRRLWDRIDASARIDAPAASELPPTDFVVHVAVWAAVTFLVGLAVWSWSGLVVAVVATAVLSAGVELAQGRWSISRSVEFDDAVANVAGVAAGALLAGACYALWSGVARLVHRIALS